MSSRCPYHVKQGFIDENSRLVLTDICGLKSAGGEHCSYAPFDKQTPKSCPRYLMHAKGLDRQVLVPKSDIEYLPEVSGTGNFSETDFL